jgi:hypothetical protein
MSEVRILVAILTSWCVFGLPAEAGAQDDEDVESRVARQMRFLDMTKAELTAEGRRRADVEYAEGRAEIESYGLRMMGMVNVDEESGLYIRDFGCVITNNEDVESNGYNERLRELVAEKGPPANAKGVKKRFKSLQRLVENAPQLMWKDVPWTAPQGSSEPLPLGQFTIQAEVVKNPAGEEMVRRLKETLGDFPENIARVRITRGSNHVANIRVTKRQTIKAAILADLDILALKLMPPTEELIFVDTIHGCVMWRYPVWWKKLMKNLQPAPQERALPDITCGGDRAPFPGGVVFNQLTEGSRVLQAQKGPAGPL